MVIVTDIKWKNKDDKKKDEKLNTNNHFHEGFYMDGYLAENLYPIPKFLKKEWDCVGIVSGHGKVRTGKCQSLKTKVKIKKDGNIIDSDELGKYKDGEILNTISWDFEKNKIVESKSKVFLLKDKKKLYEVELENGKKIRCSMDHKLFVKRKFCGSDDKLVWKTIELKLKDIKIGDELVCLI